jgi:S1-C subfamily serine protease
MMADAGVVAENTPAVWSVGAPERGAYVLAVDPAGPGAGAGLREGDVVTAVGGRRVSAAADVYAFVAGRRVGERVPLVYLRRGELHGSTLVVAEAPGDDRRAAGAGEGRLGVTVETQQPPLARARKGRRPGRVVVTAVEAGSLAARAGLRPGDVIVAVDRQRVWSAREAAAVLRRARARPQVLAVTSAGKRRKITVPPLAAGR